jgi:hypothetical protein
MHAIHVKNYYMIQSTGLYMGLNTNVKRIKEGLNDLLKYHLYFPVEDPKQLDQDEIIENLDQANGECKH